MKHTLVILLIALLTSCICQPENSKGKYTVWVGTAVFSVGYETDSIKVSPDSYEFKDTDGRTHIVPKNSVTEIEKR